jgi:hypothetical protein
MNNRNEPIVNVGGTKLRVRIMKPGEVVKDGDLCAWVGEGLGSTEISITDVRLDGLKWQRATQIGWKVGDAGSWVYLRVLSKFWK